MAVVIQEGQTLSYQQEIIGNKQTNVQKCLENVLTVKGKNIFHLKNVLK